MLTMIYWENQRTGKYFKVLPIDFRSERGYPKPIYITFTPGGPVHGQLCLVAKD